MAGWKNIESKLENIYENFDTIVKNSADRIGRVLDEYSTSAIETFYASYPNPVSGRQGRFLDSLVTELTSDENGARISTGFEAAEFYQGFDPTYNLVIERGVHGGIQELQEPFYWGNTLIDPKILFANSPKPPHAKIPPKEAIEKYYETYAKKAPKIMFEEFKKFL